MAQSLSEIQLALDALHTEAKGALSKTVSYVCPFGCKQPQCDEYGYCRHLVGFTNDQETYEPIAPFFRYDGEGIPFDTGFKKVQGREPCLPDDVFVNPERVQVVEGIARMAKAWVSDRVYRHTDELVEPRAPAPRPMSELARLQREAADLAKRLEEKKLREDVARMKKELAEAELEEATRPSAAGE